MLASSWLVCVCEREREKVCVCVCVRERLKDSVSERKSKREGEGWRMGERLLQFSSRLLGMSWLRRSQDDLLGEKGGK